MNCVKTVITMMLTAAVLNSCTDNKSKNGKIAKDFDDIIDIKNIPPEDITFGDIPSSTDIGPSGFTATYDVIVYFGFNEMGKFVSTVRYFDKVSNSYDANLKNRVSQCVSIIDANIGAACAGQNAKVANLDDFTFKAPANVIFVAKNSSLQFDETPLVFGKRLLKQYDGHPAKRAKPNKSFYYIQRDQIGDHHVIYTKNYYRKKGSGGENSSGPGDTLIGPNERFWYSLNIFMTIEHEGGQRTKLIIDPDTGNMGGNP